MLARPKRVWNGQKREVLRLDCVQIQHGLPMTPLLPPDVIQNSSDISCDGTSRTTRFKDVDVAREEYNRLRLAKLSSRRKRLFVFGAVYDSFFPGYYEVDPTLSDYDLVVTLHSRKESNVKIRLIRPDESIEKTNLLSSIVELGRSLSGPGNARGYRVGDIGSMHAIGLKSSSTNNVYVTSENTIKKAATASVAVREWLEDHMRDVLRGIVQTDTNLKVQYPASLPRGPGSRMMVSVNLANSPHLDSGDTSESIAIWVEERPGTAKNWYFVLPNVSYEGKQGLVVKLVHGVVVSWDGREIFHCSSKPELGQGNKVYGCMWGSSRTK